MQWYASYEEVARVGEPGKESYPTGCSGWLWVTSPGTARALAEAAQQVNTVTVASPELCTIRSNKASITMNSRIICIIQVNFLWIDDVWVTGYLAQHLNIQHQARLHSTAWYFYQ